MLTYREAQERVEQIKKIKTDEATAHELEDRLWREVLEAIDKGEVKDLREIRRLAHTALDTRRVSFFRWYTDGH